VQSCLIKCVDEGDYLDSTSVQCVNEVVGEDILLWVWIGTLVIACLSLGRKAVCCCSFVMWTMRRPL